MVCCILHVACLLGDVLPTLSSPDLSPLPRTLQGSPQLGVLTLGVLGLVPEWRRKVNKTNDFRLQLNSRVK